MVRRTWPAILMMMLSALAAGSTPAKSPNSAALEQRERQGSWPLRRAQYIDVPHISSRPACADLQPREALTRPGRLFTTGADGRKVKVSGIIGTDGRVNSPLILESAGLAGDR